MICSLSASPPLEDHAVLLRRHLVSISEAIVRTRRGIVALRREQEAGRAGDELHAVVWGTELATDAIPTASETVDRLTPTLEGRRWTGSR